MLKNQKGFAHQYALLILLVAAVCGIFLFVKAHQPKKAAQTIAPPNSAPVQKSAATPKQTVNWYRPDGGGWAHSGTPPACPAQPMLASPVDLSLATSILYPGQ